MMTVCEVCRLLDGDTREKECEYCGVCDAYICADDKFKLDRRAKAVLELSRERRRSESRSRNYEQDG